MRVTGWLHRLRERGVIRVAASYALIAWLLLQIADVTFEPLGVPRWVMVSLIVAAVLGFPLAVALAWFYEAGDAGVAPDTAPAGVARPAVHGVRRYADVAIISVLLTAVAVLLVRQSDLGSPSTAANVIAVLPFRDLSTESDGEVLALGIAESVLHQLASLAEIVHASSIRWSPGTTCSGPSLFTTSGTTSRRRMRSCLTSSSDIPATRPPWPASARFESMRWDRPPPAFGIVRMHSPSIPCSRTPGSS